MTDEIIELPFGLSDSPHHCKIDPIVPSSIFHYYIRRPSKQGHIIGALLGNIEANNIILKNAFVVPKEEADEEKDTDVGNFVNS